MSSQEKCLLGIEGEIVNESSLDGIVKVAILGCGSHSYRNILPSLNYIQEAKLIATCDLNEEKARLYAKQFGADNYFTDLHKMTSSIDLDAILVVAGFDPHTGKPRYPEIVHPLLEKGIPVWMEKPPAANAEELKILIEAANKGKTFAQVGFKMMFAPAVEKVHSLIQSDEFGAVQSFTATYAVDLPHDIRNLHDPASRRFLDDIVHVLSQIEFLFGSPNLLTYYFSGKNDGFAVLEYENGLTGVIHMKGGAGIIGPAESLEIVGSGNILKLQGGTKIIHHQKGDPGSYGRETAFIRKDGTHTDTYSSELRQPLGALSLHSHALYGYISELRHFVRNIISKKEPQKADLEDAFRIMQVYDAFSGEPNIPFRIGTDKPRLEIHPLTAIIRDFFTCDNCGNQDSSTKDGWSVVCAPPEGCGKTFSLFNIEKGEQGIDKHKLIQMLLAKCKEDGYKVDNPAFEFRRSGKLRDETPRLYVSVSPNKQDGKKYFVKVPINKTDNSILSEYQIIKSQNLAPFSVPKPLKIILDKSVIFEYINGVSFESYLIERKEKGGWDLIKKDINLVNIVNKIAEFHDRNITRKNDQNKYVGSTHNDFDPFNIILPLNSEDIVLLDWEDFSRDGFQLLDILHFVMMSGVIYFSEFSEGKLAQAIISDKGPFVDFSRSVIDTYCRTRQHEVKPCDLSSMIPLYAKTQIKRLEKTNRDYTKFLYPYLLDRRNETPLWLK